MKSNILLKAPVLTRSGYGEHSRFVLRSLRSREDLFNIFIQPIQWGATSWLNELNEERKWIDETIEKTIIHIQQGGSFDISLQVTIPNEWEKIAPVNIGVTAGIETTKVAPLWLQKGNESVDRIITISRHSKDSYVNTVAMAQNNQTGENFEYRLQNPIDYVNYPAKVFDSLPELELGLSTDFNFLTVAQFGPRKNLPNTIKWFIEEFHDDDVGLIVKTNMAKNCIMDREIVVGNIKNITRQFPDKKCKVYLLHGDMSDEEMHSLYQHEKVSSLVALPHGEGFGLPIFEAAYSGIPVVATGWSGHLDFLTDEEGKEHFYNVSFDLQPVQGEVVWENVLIAESMWAYPREQSAKQKMRQCYTDIVKNNNDSYAAKSGEYSNMLRDRFSNDKQMNIFVSHLEKYTAQSDDDWLSEIEDIVKEYE
jgi:glycosyltransferase involved in cell wall biosynthesis